MPLVLGCLGAGQTYIYAYTETRHAPSFKIHCYIIILLTKAMKHSSKYFSGAIKYL